ncbi:MAG TPA: O-acetyl-ADP-ribose deacetylase [Spirochaetota bacterium]|nr:O-acetyl-ADP-ribose deacetylase [Spirochaetota bacterium]HPC39474.1 O-acetyl-ADP-ribose deacetylase [Spirochaetota bacterium]HPL15862.1 O-acetyl-ADP-ribose deacetylase [Spirochaetota bacterium]HQF06811.1 O-acetyl-ADP-ribose deacetylase [Spirochaetota bacterium]HQH95570.1 O-acetyl-ADP-ribose deacetylase [Spirochaetota bacterium]
MSPIQEIIKHLHVKQGDITREATDAIVNAANPSLLGGGGVDGAIHRAAGPGLLQECRKLGGCPHGEARITGGHNLKAKHVIHTPGPIYRNGKSGEPEILKQSYMNSLLLARENQLQSIAFPAISTGVYGYPREAACKIAVDTAVEFMKNYDYLIDIYFVLFDKENAAIYSEYIESLKS